MLFVRNGISLPQTPAQHLLEIKTRVLLTGCQKCKGLAKWLPNGVRNRIWDLEGYGGRCGSYVNIQGRNSGCFCVCHNHAICFKIPNEIDFAITGSWNHCHVMKEQKNSFVHVSCKFFSSKPAKPSLSRCKHIFVPLLKPLIRWSYKAGLLELLSYVLSSHVTNILSSFFQ